MGSAAGAEAIANAGLIEAAAGGTVVVSSAVANTGTLAALASGVLTLARAVGGTGAARLDGGTIDFKAAFSEAVDFTANGGTLELAHSKSYGGVMEGFSSRSTLDLDDIQFAPGTTKATFSGNATQGVLAVTSGTATAKITLSGDYLATVFAVSTDGHGGTLVTTPPAAAPPPLSPVAMHAFVAAAAALSAGAMANAVGSRPIDVAPLARFATPRPAFA